MTTSKFLIHWTGKDLVERRLRENLSEDWLVTEYTKRLKDDYQNGLFTERKKEKDVLRAIAIGSLVRICFSEIRLSQAEIHAERFGDLGIGFSRDFVAKKGGRRVLYVPEPEGGLLEQSIKDAWEKSEGNAEIRNRLKWVFAFCKPMSNGKPEDSVEYRDHYEEMEWRLVYGESSDRSGAFTNTERHIHRVKFDSADVKLIVFPNDEVKRLTFGDDEMKLFFASHQPNLINLEDCRHF